MHKLIRRVLNSILSSSTYIFDDGSRLDYYVRLDIIRYRTGEPIPRVVDIALSYNQTKSLLSIKRNVVWKWRDPRVPLTEWSETGPGLSESERLEVCQRLRNFIDKQPKRFEPLG